MKLIIGLYVLWYIFALGSYAYYLQNMNPDLEEYYYEHSAPYIKEYVDGLTDDDKSTYRKQLKKRSHARDNDSGADDTPLEHPDNIFGKTGFFIDDFWFHHGMVTFNI